MHQQPAVAGAALRHCFMSGLTTRSSRLFGWLSSRIFKSVSSNHCCYAWNALVSITRRDAQWPIVRARRSREVPRKYARFTRTCR